MKMLTRHCVICLPIILLVLVAGTEAQVRFQVGVGAGVRLPRVDYGGETTEYYAGSKYGLSAGYTIQAKGRVSLGGFLLVGGLEYGRLSNSGQGEPGRGSVEVSQSVFTFKVGPEFSFSLPATPLMPYLGGNLGWHSISGTTTFHGLTKVPSGTFDVESASRIGMGLNGGAVIKIGTAMYLDLGVEYTFVNPLSKSWTTVDVKNEGRIDSYKALNDDRDPEYAAGSENHFVGAARSISFLQITATLMFAL